MKMFEGLQLLHGIYMHLLAAGIDLVLLVALVASMGCKEIDTSSLKLFRLYVNCGSWSSPKDPGSCARLE